MSAAEKIPWQELTLTAKECAELWSVTPEYFLQAIACKPEFPERMTAKPATWKAGEIVEYRNANRAGRRARLRSFDNR